MRRALLLMAFLVVPPIATAIVTTVLRTPDRFAEVEPGRLYRGGYPSARQVESLAERHGLKTIVNLTTLRGAHGKPVNAEAADEIAAAAKLGIRILPFPMPGNGQAEFNLLDSAADALADAANRPVYFHCAAGKMRSGATLAAYRMKHCGWSYDRAMAEAADYDLSINDEKDRDLREHLRKYATYLRDKHGIATVLPEGGK